MENTLNNQTTYLNYLNGTAVKRTGVLGKILTGARIDVNTG